MYKQIKTIADLLMSMAKILPSTLGISFYLQIMKFLFWYNTKFLNHYIDMLLNTENYYGTLKTINSNKWCPDDLPVNFIQYVNDHHIELIHA